MIFTQNININNMVNNQGIMKICTEHPDCEDCPLLNDDAKDSTSVITCETARIRRDNK